MFLLVNSTTKHFLKVAKMAALLVHSLKENLMGKKYLAG